MKLFKSIIYICLITISLCSVAMIYGETRQSQWIDKFIDSFELTNSNFKFYNIKANMMIEKDIDMNELQNICLLIAQNLTNNKDEVCLKTEKSQVYVNYNDKNTGEMWSRIENADMDFINFEEAYQFILANRIKVYNILHGSWQIEIQEFERKNK